MQLIEHKMTLSVKILKSLTRRGVVMPEYNITLAYSALKPPPGLNCDRNQKTRALNPKDSREKYCQTRISKTNIVRQGYQIKILSDNDIK